MAPILAGRGTLSPSGQAGATHVDKAATDRPGFARLRSRDFELSLGLMYLVLGAVALVLPGQFPGRMAAVLAAWGGLSILGGALLVSAAVELIPGALVLVVHAVALLTSWLLAAGFAISGDRSGVIIHGALGLGIVLNGFWARIAPRLGPGNSLLGLVFGIIAVVLGTVMVVAPYQIDAPAFGSPALFGGLFLAAGAGLLAAQTTLLSWRNSWRTTYLAAGAVYAGWAAVSALPFGRVDDGAFYGGFGLILALSPWVSTRMRQSGVVALRWQVTVALGLAAGTPLILGTAVAGQQVAQLATEHRLAQDRLLALNLAADLAEGLALDRAFLDDLAILSPAPDANAISNTADLQSALDSENWEQLQGMLGVALVGANGDLLGQRGLQGADAATRAWAAGITAPATRAVDTQGARPSLQALAVPVRQPTPDGVTAIGAWWSSLGCAPSLSRRVSRAWRSTW